MPAIRGRGEVLGWARGVLVEAAEEVQRSSIVVELVHVWGIHRILLSSLKESGVT